MLLDPAMVRAVASDIADAANGAIEDYNDGRVVDEPNITDRMLGAIVDRLRAKTIRGVVWRALTLRSSHGAANEEQRHGADFFVTLDIALPGISVKKGFLVQAKRAEPGQQLSNHEWLRLGSQCDNMLAVTPDAFVVVYSRNRGACFVPAVDVRGSTVRDLFAHYNRGVQSFFELFIECFVGDRKLHTADIKVLDELRPVQQVLALIARAAV